MTVRSYAPIEEGKRKNGDRRLGTECQYRVSFGCSAAKKIHFIELPSFHIYCQLSYGGEVIGRRPDNTSSEQFWEVTVVSTSPVTEVSASEDPGLNPTW